MEHKEVARQPSDLTIFLILRITFARLNLQMIRIGLQ
ncbi:hypothetical protein PS862_01621 [Pseudomonas fluorescens]|uniref:Uncharacterized protein n=1 Tax=Pseudomonas fluorescens TaxID=294 RepID=A0A5E6Q078_PSEFL|nr:hypothetical protein PS639_00584 [Pseudomonas fluorescens]VVO76863.1 hypothetical protein PS862_01621 [Pseudomonas fluorescens]